MCAGACVFVCMCALSHSGQDFELYINTLIIVFVASLTETLETFAWTAGAGPLVSLHSQKWQHAGRGLSTEHQTLIDLDVQSHQRGCQVRTLPAVQRQGGAGRQQGEHIVEEPRVVSLRWTCSAPCWLVMRFKNTSGNAKPGAYPLFFSFLFRHQSKTTEPKADKCPTSHFSWKRGLPPKFPCCVLSW